MPRHQVRAEIVHMCVYGIYFKVTIKTNHEPLYLQAGAENLTLGYSYLT